MEGIAAHLIGEFATAGSVPRSGLVEIYRAVEEDDSRFVAETVSLGLLTEATAYRIYAAALGLAFVEPDAMQIDRDLVERVPPELIRRHRLLPLAEQDRGILVAMSDPLDLLAVDAVQEVVGQAIVPALAGPNSLEAAIEFELHEGGSVEKLIAGLDLRSLEQAKFSTLQDLKDLAGDDAIIELVDFLIGTALRRRASDLHIEPEADHVRVRLRVDGQLLTQQLLPRPLHPAITSRVKILASMDISERRKPQDGRFHLDKGGNGQVEIRVSSLPSVHGEKIVMRVLDKRRVELDLTKQGFRKKSVELMQNAAMASTGLVLVTGPTGSGKTTTLYGLLQFLNDERHNLVTVEDPVEYVLPGITQVAVDRNIDRTFHGTLRSILRQDPDVIMVGEIRDAETARTAIHAGLTGHMVLSTLHTNNAIGAVTRLVDMGVEPFLLGPTIRAVVAQRLVRRLCNSCKVPGIPDETILRKFGFAPDKIGRIASGFRLPKGCAACGGQGYSGRIPVQEVLRWTPRLASLLSRGAPEAELLQAAREDGFKEMLHDGAVKAVLGLTTLEEVFTATRS